MHIGGENEWQQAQINGHQADLATMAHAMAIDKKADSSFGEGDGG